MGDAIRVIDRRLARCQFRPAPQARTEQCFLRGERAFEETAIFLQRCFHWTDRPAVNSGGGDADEKNPVEARIARGQSAIGSVTVDHSLPLTMIGADTSHFLTLDYFKFYVLKRSA